MPPRAPHPISGGAAYCESRSMRYLLCFDEFLPLRLRRTDDQPRETRQYSILVAGLQTYSRQKIRTDHFQAVASRLVTPKHQTGCFKRLLDDRQLALVGLEIKDVPGSNSFPVRYLETSRLNSSLGSSRFVATKLRYRTSDRLFAVPSLILWPLTSQPRS